MTITLTLPYHDPQGQLYERVAQMLPTVDDLFTHLAIQASALAYEPTLALFTQFGAKIEHREPDPPNQPPQYGKFRRAALALALQTNSSFIMFGEPDRFTHWLAHYPAELKDVVAQIPQHDFTVLGRTPRAFATHPRIQTATEGLVNEVFARVSGYDWDVTSAARGMSRRAAEAIVDGCLDDTIGVDPAWPLFIQQQGGFSMSYIATEGLEYETADYMLDQPTPATRNQWRDAQDSAPQKWAARLNLARLHMESMRPFAAPNPT